MLKRIKEIYHYREMIFSLVRRELRGKYKASVLGFLWTFLIPLLQLVVYSIVFGVILNSEIENYPMYLFVTLIPWNFFSSTVSGGAMCVIGQENLVKKIYFPRVVLPIAYATSMFINMLLTFIVIFAVLLVSGFGIHAGILPALPIVMIIEYILALGLCMIFSALAVYFRDLEYILNIVMMAWMYLTPIFYSIEIIPASVKGIFLVNPMTAIIVSYQRILYYKELPHTQELLQAGIVSVIILGIGYAIFERVQKRFVEEL